MENISYPIKYGIMPLKIEIKGNNFKIVTKVNIVSKCYLISETRKYQENYKINYEYEVVFPYMIDGVLDLDNPYDSETKSIFKKVWVDNVFNSLEEAMKKRDDKNKQTESTLINSLSSNGKPSNLINSVKEQYVLLREKCLKYEEEILLKTIDLHVLGRTKNLEQIINSMYEHPRCFYIKLAGYLSQEEKDYLKHFIDNKSCLNCFSTSCKLKSHDEINGENCVYWNNSELIGRQKVKTK